MAKNRTNKVEETSRIEVNELPEIKEIIEESIKTPIYKVKVMHPKLRIRTTPSTDGEVVDHITNQGVYTIFAEKNGWGQLEDDNWIMLSYTQKIK